MFDLLKTIHDPIDGRLLPGTGFITNENFSMHQRKAAFYRLKSELYLFHIIGNEIDTPTDVS